MVVGQLPPVAQQHKTTVVERLATGRAEGVASAEDRPRPGSVAPIQLARCQLARWRSRCQLGHAGLPTALPSHDHGWHPGEGKRTQSQRTPRHRTPRPPDGFPARRPATRALRPSGPDLRPGPALGPAARRAVVGSGDSSPGARGPLGLYGHCRRTLRPCQPLSRGDSRETRGAASERLPARARPGRGPGAKLRRSAPPLRLGSTLRRRRSSARSPRPSSRSPSPAPPRRSRTGGGGAPRPGPGRGCGCRRRRSSPARAQGSSSCPRRP